MKFINNYWDKASNGRININTNDAYLIPSADNTFTLSQSIRYYSDPDSLDYRLAELVYETIIMAIDSGEYLSDNDGLIIYHAGAGQDFKIDLDNSPFDIPSFYFDETYLSEFLPYDKYNALVSANCMKGVVLPESQNQLSVNIALNGTEILLTGMLLGLPTLYDTEFGRSGAGTYGLMDQGSNLGSGLCPIKPSAFERYFLGSAEPVEINTSQSLTLLRDEVYKLSISSNEYFLVEFRKNSGLWADSLMWSRDDIGDYLDVLRVMDSLDLIDYTLENGVLIDISDQDIGLPTSGLLIWHIIEPEFFGENPNGEDAPFLNLVEADGGDDIGKWYGTFDPSVNNGWKWDMWFYNNPAYKDNNPASYKLQFNDSTHPNTRSKGNLSSGINIRDFKFYADSVVIQLIMDPPADYNFAGMVFDEMTNAFQYIIPEPNLLLGYRDSSVMLFDGTGLLELYKHDTTYVKGQTAFLSYPNSLIQITNSETSSDVSFLFYPGGTITLNETKSIHISHPIDLENIAIHADTVFLPPLPIEIPDGSDVSPQPRAIYKLHVSSWTLNETDETVNTVIPYIENDKIKYIESEAATLMNGELICSEDIGFSIDGSLVTGIYPDDYVLDFHPDYYIPHYADMHMLKQIIPLHLNNDCEYEILALTEVEGNRTLSAFSHNGPLLNNYPVYENYTELRVYELGGSPMIVAYDPVGIIDIINIDGSKYYSMPAPVNAASFFIEQIAADTAWIVTDGSIIPISSSGVYWGYDGKDAAYSNASSATQTGTPVVSGTLIKNELIYNYPNPIETDRTKFRFFATGATRATINIFALDGRHITMLVQNVIDQQWNEIPWFVNNQESGVYIAKIDITDGTTTETYFVKPAILK